MPQFHIDTVVPKDSAYPYIVNFQNAYANEKFKQNECRLLKNKETGKIAIATELNDLIYTGEEEDDDLAKKFILAHNKITGKVRLIEVSSIDLKPVLKCNLDTTQLMETSTLELSRKFGSKKNKKIMEQREKLKMNVDTVTEQMTNISQNITEEKLDISAYNKSDAELVYTPPMNREATKVEDVYDLNAILSEFQYEQISKELENSNCMNNLNPFLKSIAENNFTNKQRVLFIYANMLLDLFAISLREFQKKGFQACPHSTTLNEVIFDNFTTNINGKRGRPMHLKDKMLCHAIVFILLVNNYKFDYDNMCKVLKFTPSTVQRKAAVCGASIVGTGSKKYVQLKLPLAKPNIRRRSGKF